MLTSNHFPIQFITLKRPTFKKLGLEYGCGFYSTKLAYLVNDNVNYENKTVNSSFEKHIMQTSYQFKVCLSVIILNRWS